MKSPKPWGRNHPMPSLMDYSHVIKLDIEEKRREMKIMTKMKIKYGFIKIKESATTLIKDKYLESK